MKRYPASCSAPTCDAGGVGGGARREGRIGATGFRSSRRRPTSARAKVKDRRIAAFRSSLAGSGIRAVVSHDRNYLINLASRTRRCARRAFRRLRRAGALPGARDPMGRVAPGTTSTIGLRGSRATLALTPSVWRRSRGVGLLIEGTAGSGTALGSTFEELRALRTRSRPAWHARVGFCLDTAHSARGRVRCGYGAGGGVGAVRP